MTFPNNTNINSKLYESRREDYMKLPTHRFQPTNWALYIIIIWYTAQLLLFGSLPCYLPVLLSCDILLHLKAINLYLWWTQWHKTCCICNLWRYSTFCELHIWNVLFGWQQNPESSHYRSSALPINTYVCDLL
jgi:hypothetical protein